MTSGRSFRQRAVSWFRRWGSPVSMLLVVILVGPDVIADVRSSPSVYDWSRFGCLVILVVGLLLFVRGAVRGDRHTPPPRLDPSAVPDDAVHEAISTTDDRISAVRVLREAYPGLGLKDAVVLVDAHR